MTVRVADVLGAIEEAFPPAWAEPWDNVGLLAGDPYAPVTGVLVTLDPTIDAIERALAKGCSVIVSHHPAHLDSTKRFTPGTTAGVAFAAVAAGVALIAAHTNLDRAPDAGAALARAAGLEPGGPLESSAQAVEIVTTFAPAGAADSVRRAMAEAGAGRVGDYRGCSFTAFGDGRFTPGVSAHPTHGLAGEPTRVDEERIEMVAASGQGGAVAQAARREHPYEEPLVVVTQATIARGAARMGAVCDLQSAKRLGSLAQEVASELDCTPRIWGDPELEITRVACATGSGGSLIDDAKRAGAQALLAGEIRYHDASAAMTSGLAILEVGHDVSEWPLVPLLGAAVAGVDGLDESFVYVDRPARGWWTP